jgi:hypothetical protein
MLKLSTYEETELKCVKYPAAAFSSTLLSKRCICILGICQKVHITIDDRSTDIKRFALDSTTNLPIQLYIFALDSRSIRARSIRQTSTSAQVLGCLEACPRVD